MASTEVKKAAGAQVTLKFGFSTTKSESKGGKNSLDISSIFLILLQIIWKCHGERPNDFFRQLNYAMDTDCAAP